MHCLSCIVFANKVTQRIYVDLPSSVLCWSWIIYSVVWNTCLFAKLLLQISSWTSCIASLWLLRYLWHCLEGNHKTFVARSTFLSVRYSDIHLKHLKSKHLHEKCVRLALSGFLHMPRLMYGLLLSLFYVKLFEVIRIKWSTTDSKKLSLLWQTLFTKKIKV